MRPYNGRASPRWFCRSCSCSRTSGRKTAGLIALHRPLRTHGFASACRSAGKDRPHRGSRWTFFASASQSMRPPLRHFRPHKRPPARRERSGEPAISKSELELWWHVAIGWHIAVDFKTDADFNQNRCRPSHGVLLWASENSRAERTPNRK